jgi:two-component system, cell cycle sensor histidine kinase and response regulator CckA
MVDNPALRPIEILLVEDSPTDRLLALEALGRSNVINSVHVVENGVDALDYLRRHGKFKDARRPDLVLLDLNLPRKDGREVLSEIKADPRLELIPVIVLSTSGSDDEVRAAYGKHANGYITKPVDFLQFTQALAALGGFWFEVVSLPPEGRAEVLARADAPRPLPLPSPAEDVLKVLLVEDSPSDTLLIREALAADGIARFELTHVTHMERAEELLKQGGFDLVITDLGLPDSTDLETVRRVRRVGSGIPIVVLTGLDDDAKGLQSLREGAHDYLVKGELTPRAVARAARYAIDKREQQEQLRQSQRLEAVGRLAAGIAHDFNNVLTIVRGNAELLTEDARPDVRSAAAEIQEATDRAMALARQLLTFSRQQAMHEKPVDLNQVVGDFTRMLRRLLGKDIKLELRLAAALPMVSADTGMLEQILLNLAINARDAMPSGGKLCVETRAVDISVAGARGQAHAYPGQFSSLRVSDTGVGMSQEVLERVFEPFFSTKPLGQGTGLGLATVHGIVQQHRGWLDVSSRVGAGTSFEVFLPCVAAPAVPAQPERVATGVASETILVVEDEEILRKLAGRVLERQGYRVLTAASGPEAHALWKDHGDRVDLVLTDLVLPEGETGRQLAEALTEQRPDLRVVYMSGYSPDFLSEGFVLDAGYNFLQKPFPLSQLLETVRRRLDAA